MHIFQVILIPVAYLWLCVDASLPTTELNCQHTHCVCFRKTVECKGHGRRLPYIPKIHGLANKLVFVNNYLPRITRETFYNISAADIRHLNLTQNDINTITEDALVDFKGLAVLDISSNLELALDMLGGTFGNTLFLQMAFLRLNNVSNTGRIPGNLFHNVTGNKIQKISLQWNNMLSFDGNMFQTLTSLHLLDLSNNRISFVRLGGMKTLTRLYLNQNNLESVPVFQSADGSALVPKLKSLEMKNNRIKHLGTNDFIHVNRVKDLGLLNNPIHDIHDNVFSPLRKLGDIRILPIGRSLKYISSYAFNTSKAYRINLADALFKFKNGSFDAVNIFRHCPRLRVLILSYNSVPHDPSTAISMFSPLTQLRQLTLQSVGWTYIPHGLFDKLTSLQTLELDTNNIFSLSFNNPFHNVKTLRYLGLAGNNINTISKNFLPDYVLRNLTTLNLARNPFSCICQNKWFVNWLNKTNLTLQEYPSSYICVTPANWKGKLLTTYNEDCEYTRNETITIVIASCASFVVVMFLIGVFVYKLRWHLRYWLYVFYGKHKTYSEIDHLDSEYLYDGFVVYCDSDRAWVHDKLVPFLENDYGYKLCLHYRDFLVGNLIVDNIIDNMRCSRKLVLIITNAFCKSKWCQFEILMAHERFLNNENVLVTILLEEVKSKYFTNTLKRIMTSTTYAEWTDNSSGQYVFWEQIKNAFQCNT